MGFWYSRNLLYHGGKIQSFIDVFTFIKSYSLEIKGLEEKFPRSLPGWIVSWKLTPSNVAKVNFDASFCCSNRKSCSGVVICNDQGLLLGSCFTLHHHITSAFAAEAVAAVSGLKFAIQLGLQTIILEGDARFIIVKLQSNSKDLSVLSPTISDGKSLATKFRQCIFQYVSRSANRVAYTMTRKGLLVSLDSFWVKEALLEVSAIVDEDRKFLDPI